MWSAVPHPQPLLPLLPWGVTLALALWAALAESQGKSVSRAALFAASAAGLGFGWISGGLPGLADATVASMALAAPFALLVLASRGDWRDASLMAGVGAWLGLHTGAVAMLSISLAGLLYALGYAMHRRRLAVALASTTGVARVVVWSVLGSEVSRGATSPGGLGEARGLLAERMPYGPAVFAGLLMAGFWSLTA